MSGNLKPFVLQSSTAVAFTLEVGGSQVLNETYYPGNGNLIEIDLREVVESYLSFTFPSSDVFNQTLLVRSFTAKFDGQTVSFNAIRAGKARLNQSASEFLKENFLTWQPQVKPVTYYSPEWLTYYAVETCRIKLKAYFEDGTSSETTLSSPSAGTCYTLNLQYGVVSGKFSGKRPTYYDVWVESTGGQRLTYVQRYIGSQRRSEDENWYLFENSLGGLDSLRAYGALEDAPEYEHNVSQLDGVLTEYRVDTSRKYTRNTGYLTPQESAWLQDMFSSRQKYAYTASGYYKIVFTDSDGSRSSVELPSSYTFTYQFAEDLPFLDIQRREDLPDNLELKTPEGETFFLPPRLAEFPKLSLSPDLLLPAQEPHTEKWGTITAGTLKDTVLNELIEQLQGLDIDPEPSGGLDAYLIKVGDMTVPTDDNIFSAARTLQEIQKNSLWELVTKALDGSDLPEEQQYLTPLLGRSVVVPGDVIAYADGGEYASGLPVADTATYGLVKVDGTTVRINASGQLEADAGGGIDFTVGAGLNLSAASVLSVKFGTTAGTVCQGNDSRLHTHSNKSYLDEINQNLGTSHSPTFKSMTLSEWTIDGVGGDLNLRHLGQLAAYLSGANNGNFVAKGTIIAEGDVIAYADGGSYASGLPVADSSTYGLIKYDGTTIGKNSSGQLYVINAGSGGGSNINVIDSLTSQSQTDALSANQGYQLDQRLKNVKWGTPDGTDYVRVYLGSEYRDLSKNGHSHAWSTITSKPSWIGSTKPSYSWSEITNKPTVITSISVSKNGSGNAVGSLSVSGSTIYYNMTTISGGGSSWNGGTITNGITISNSGTVGISISTGTPFVKFGSKWKIQSGSDLNFYYGSGSALAYFSGSNRGNLWIAGTLSQNSDMRLKTVVSPITDVLKAISTFNVFRYKYNNDRLGRVRIGMSAQQVKIYYPELVFTESDGYYSMDYVSMSAVLVGGIKELYTRFQPVENKVKALESRVQNLQLRLDNAYREIFELKQQKGGAA